MKMSIKHSSNLLSGSALLSALLLFAGCNSTDGPATPQEQRTAIQVSSGIQTKAYDNKWEENDAIGVFMLNGNTLEQENNKYTTIGSTGTFSADATNTIYFPIDGTRRDFVAYYPYQSLSQGATTLTLSVNDQYSQKKIDLMGCSKVTGKHKNNPKVNFAFNHKLVKIVMTIEPEYPSLTRADLQSMKVEITNQQLKGTYNVLKGGDVTVDKVSDPADITLRTTADGTFSEGIILPNTSTAGMQLRFTLRNGMVFTWIISTAPSSKRYEAGNKYIYSITLKRTALEVTSTITNWGSGNGNGESGSAE